MSQFLYICRLCCSHNLLQGGLLTLGCWNPTTDTVIFEFYCDPGEGCDTVVQFWYRLTPSPVGAGKCIHVADCKLLIEKGQ